MSISSATMFPQAKLHIFRSSAIRKLIFTERYLVAGHVSGDFAVLDLICQHIDAKTCEHQRALQVGPCWYFDCHGDILATGNEDCKIRLWNLSTGSMQLTLTGHTRKPHAILFLNPTTVISGSENGEVMLWDIPSGERRRTLTGHNDKVISLNVHNNMLASGSADGTVRIWDLGSTSTESIHVLDGQSGYVGLLGFSPNGSLLATGAGGGETKIWHVNSGSCRATCVGHTKVVTQFFNHANDQLISSSADGTIRIWEWATGSLIDTFKICENADANNALRGFAWYKNYLISGGMNGLFRVWDWQNRQSHVDLRTEATQSVYHLVSQGQLIAIAVKAGEGKHLIEVWNVSSLDLDREIQRAAQI